MMMKMPIYFRQVILVAYNTEYVNEKEVTGQRRWWRHRQRIDHEFDDDDEDDDDDDEDDDEMMMPINEMNVS